MASTLENVLSRVKQILSPTVNTVSNAFQAAGQALNKQQPISPIRMAPQNTDTGYGIIGTLQRGLQQAELARISAFRDAPRITDEIVKNNIKLPRLKVKPSIENPISGQQMASNATYNYLIAPIAEQAINVPKNIIGYGAKALTGSPYTNQEVLANLAAPSLELTANAFGMRNVSPAVSVVSNIAENAAKTTFKKAFIEGAKNVAPYGAVTGFAQGLIRNQNNKTAVDQVLNSLPDTAIGTIVSGMIGGSISGGSYLFGKMVNNLAKKISTYKPNASEAELKADARGFLHDTAGRWAGRVKKTPTYYNDLWEEMGMNRDGTPKVGMSIQEVTPKMRTKIKAQQETAQQIAESMGVKAKIKVKPEVPPIETPEIKGTFTPKPGELNVNKLNLTDAQKQELYDKQGKDIVEKLTNKEIKDLADGLGMDQRTFTKDQIGAAAAKQLNMRGRVVELENQLTELQKNGGSLADIEALNKEIDTAMRASASQGTMASHLLSVRKIIANEFITPRQKVFALLQKAGVNPNVYTKQAAGVDFNNPDEVVKFYRSLVPPNWTEKLDLIRYNSMLSSPKTQLVNITSNWQGTGLVEPVKKTYEGVIDSIASAINPSRKRTRFAGEGLEYVKGYYNPQTIKEGYRKFLDVMQGRSTVVHPDMERMRLWAVGKGKVWEDIMNVTTHALEGMDQLFTTLTKSGLEKSNALRIKRGGKILLNPEEEATRLLFRGKLVNGGEGVISNTLGDVGNRIAGLSESKIGLVRFISKMTIPFLKVGTNLAKEGFAYNPVTGAINLIGNEDKIAQLAKMAVGGSIMALGVPLALSDRLTGSSPSSKTERDARINAGIPDYSVKIGDTWFQYSKLHPALAWQLDAVAELSDAFRKGKITDNVASKIGQGIWNWNKFGLKQTYYKNVSDFIGSLENGDVETGLARFSSNYPAQFIPFRAFGGWLNGVIDKYVRQPDADAGFVTKSLQNFAAQIPGLSFFVPTKEDASGQPLEKPNRLINLFSPWKISEGNQEAEAYLRLLETYNKNNRNMTDLENQIKKNLKSNEKVDTTGLSQLGINPNLLETKQQQLDAQIYKQEFELSGKKYAEHNGKIYMNDEGTIRVIDKIDFEKSVKDATYSLMSDRLKRDENFPEWIKNTTDYVNFLQEYQSTLDPTFDAAKIVQIQNKIEDLGYQAAKYAKQGGFSGRKGSSKKMTAVKIPVAKFQAKSPFSTKKTKIRYTKPRVVAPPKFNIKPTKKVKAKYV